MILLVFQIFKIWTVLLIQRKKIIGDLKQFQSVLVHKLRLAILKVVPAAAYQIFVLNTAPRNFYTLSQLI